MLVASSPPMRGTASPSPPAYTFNHDLLSQKRLDRAIDEIRDLHAQLETMRGSGIDFRKEMVGLRDTLGAILRKESTMVRTRPPLPRLLSSPDLVPSSPTDADEVIPVPSRAQSQPRTRRRDMLQIRTDLEPPPSSSLKQSTFPGMSPPLAPPITPTFTLSCNGVDVVLSPTKVTRAPWTPCFDSHKSPL
jgi:hypothetical protein